MRARQLLTIRAIAAVAGLALIAFAFTVSEAPQQTEHMVDIWRIGGRFRLVNDTGASVTDQTLTGKPYAIFFGYTYCPDVCPTTLFDLSRWIKQLGPDADKLNYVFVTIDPERDTPKLMRAYLASFDGRIRGFSGSPQQIASIAKAYRFYYKKVPSSDGSYVMDHSSMIYLMDADGKFVTVIRYQENDATAVDKLRHLAGAVPWS